MAQALLIDELNHRVKNTLATVQSLASQTARHTGSLDAFKRAFEDRLLALSRAHDLLTRRKWQDTPLRQLVEEITAPVAGHGRIRMEGPDVALNARSALSFTMVLNELLTNASKYGALSSPDGMLTLQWKLRRDGGGDAVLDYQWTEQGGPYVTPPMRRGFGTRLIERCVEADLGGEIDLAFEPGGVRCRMSLPVAGVTGPA
jgi:two-component sensor histidine kinase